jgi:membrane associated rhomboid family serine protease
LALNVLIGLTVARIDNWAHLGGLCGGALTAYLLGPRFVVRKIGDKTTVADVPPLPVTPFLTKLPMPG